MKYVFAVAIVAAVSSLASCKKEKIAGEGPITTETRTVANFTGISSGFAGTVNIKIDPVYKVEVLAQQNVLDVLRTISTNGILSIDYKNNVHVRTDEQVIVNVNVPSIDYINVSGSGDVNMTGHDATTRLDMGLSGNGNINVQDVAITGKVNARISGNGWITVSGGTAKNEDLSISGNGSIILSGVAVEKSVVHISGAGDARVNVSQNLEAHISGSGDVRYLGSPLITTSISGSGRVIPL